MIRHHENVIVQTVCKIMIPLIQLFALYVVAHGHYSPGGGFQGGCIFGASFILMIISFDLDFLRKRLSELRQLFLVALGVFIYGLIGLLCFFLGSEYLNYGAFSKIFSSFDAPKIRALSTLLIETGVAITVTSVMISIFISLLSSIKEER